MMKTIYKGSQLLTASAVCNHLLLGRVAVQAQHYLGRPTPERVSKFCINICYYA